MVTSVTLYKIKIFIQIRTVCVKQIMITTRQRSCGEAKFSQLFVCPRGRVSLVPCPFSGVSMSEGGYVWELGLSRGGMHMSGRVWVCSGGDGYVREVGTHPSGHGIQGDTADKREVCILLECFLVQISGHFVLIFAMKLTATAPVGTPDDIDFTCWWKTASGVSNIRNIQSRSGIAQSVEHLPDLTLWAAAW